MEEVSGVIELDREKEDGGGTTFLSFDMGRELESEGEGVELEEGEEGGVGTVSEEDLVFPVSKSLRKRIVSSKTFGAEVMTLKT